MDHLQTRLEALEQQMHTVTHRLHWWRGLACGLIVLTLLTWALPAGTGEQQSLAQRVAALESLLTHVSREGKDIFITGANLHLVNGLGETTTANSLGNLIVGYNESRGAFLREDIRTGSHNVVVGQFHDFSRFGGLVVGDLNSIHGDFASVSGGQGNTASGNFSSVSGGGGIVIVGGDAEMGLGNTASGDFAVVSGGQLNTASGRGSTVSGGQNITQATEAGWAGGSAAEEVEVGNFRSP